MSTHKRRQRSGFPLITMIVILCGAGFFIMAAVMQHSGGPPVEAQFAKAMGYVSVRNTGTNEWPSAELWINGVGQYSYQHPFPMEPDKVVEISLRDFSRDNGERFNPNTHVAKRITLIVPGHQLTGARFLN